MIASKSIAALASAALVLACASTQSELERVAKDWCLTIRASQVLPVYPLSEDVRPGDVYVVPTTLVEQARIYEEKGFLPLDQRVTRLQDLPYAAFYKDGFFESEFGKVPGRIVSASVGAGDGGAPVPAVVPAMRAAFPSYTFEVSRSGGLQLALPIQGVPAALGLMGAEKARGSVAIRDAYTYGIDSTALIEKLSEWWGSKPEIRHTLKAVSEQIQEPLFLRIVTQVYLTTGVTVSLANLKSSGAEAELGAAPELELVDLSTQDPARATAAAEAYGKVLEALSGSSASGAAGGTFRFLQASQRAVTLDETFDRPLVIGYCGFDVMVFEDGSLSAPIPSFATVRGDREVQRVQAGSFYATADLLDVWIDEEGNYERLETWIEGEQGRSEDVPSDLTPSGLIYGEGNEAMRARAIEALDVPRVPQKPSDGEE